MLQECLETFKSMCERHGEKFLVDNHVLPNGYYVVVDNLLTPFDSATTEIIKINNKHKDQIVVTDTLDEIKYAHYYSQALTSNKTFRKGVMSIIPYMYTTKVTYPKSSKNGDHVENVHSVFKALKCPTDVYKNDKRKKELYLAYTEQHPSLEMESFMIMETWLRQNIEAIATHLMSLGATALDRMNIYLRTSPENIRREYNRYLIPNICVSNQANVTIDGVTLGAHGDNFSINDAKPSLSMSGRKNKNPYLMPIEEMLIQNSMMKYLYSQLISGYSYVFVTQDNMYPVTRVPNLTLPTGQTNGYLLQMENDNGSVLIVKSQYLDLRVESISFVMDKDYVFNLKEDTLKELQGLPDVVTSVKEFEYLMNEYLFYKCLFGNYFTPNKDFKLPSGLGKKLPKVVLGMREPCFQWVYEGYEDNLLASLKVYGSMLVADTYARGYYIRACTQYVLIQNILRYLNREGNVIMTPNQALTCLKDMVLNPTDQKIEDDQTFYIGVGQLAAYMISMSKSGQRQLLESRIHTRLLGCHTSSEVKQVLIELYNKYGYAMQKSNRLRAFYLSLLDYETQKPDHNALLYGLLAKNIMYTKSVSNQEEIENVDEE